MTEGELMERTRQDFLAAMGGRQITYMGQAVPIVRQARDLLLDAIPHLEGPTRRVQLVRTADALLSLIVADGEMHPEEE